jgi:hypothetical protein
MKEITVFEWNENVNKICGMQENNVKDSIKGLS